MKTVIESVLEVIERVGEVVLLVLLAAGGVVLALWALGGEAALFAAASAAAPRLDLLRALLGDRGGRVACWGGCGREVLPVRGVCRDCVALGRGWGGRDERRQV